MCNMGRVSFPALFYWSFLSLVPLAVGQILGCAQSCQIDFFAFPPSLQLTGTGLTEQANLLEYFQSLASCLQSLVSCLGSVTVPINVRPPSIAPFSISAKASLSASISAGTSLSLDLTPTPLSSAGAFTYFGCYSDGGTARALGDGIDILNIVAATPLTCAAACVRFVYFGVAAGGNCRLPPIL